MRRPLPRGILPKVALCLGVFILSLGFGEKRAASQSCGGIPGIGNLLYCTGPFFYCGDFTYCIGYCCSGQGNCKENCGEECSFAGSCSETGLICAASCPG